MPNYKYHLQPYSATSKRTCPRCGKSKCFTLYLDENNVPAGPEYGICDHKKCGYFKYPGADVAPSTLTPVIAEPSNPIYYTREDVARYRADAMKNNLCQYIKGKFDDTKLHSILKDYCVGSIDGAIIFWQIDTHYNIHRGKCMWYNPDGHRTKCTRPDGTEYGRVKAMWQYLNRQRENEPEMCYFGQHLLPLHPDKPIALVESEKTALVMSYYYPRFNWLATLSLNNFQSYRLSFLQESKQPLIVFPDFDAYDRWKAKAESILATMPDRLIFVDDFITEYGTAKEDIADVFLTNAYILQSKFNKQMDLYFQI